MRVTHVGCCLLLLSPLVVAAQQGMSRAEATQLYGAAGFGVTKDQPFNRCGKSSQPRVAFVDVNGDQRPEALFVDEDVACYAPSGRYFAVLTKQGGIWRPVIAGTGKVEALTGRSGGWSDMRVTDATCVRTWRFAGGSYAPATDCAGRPLAAAGSTTPRAAPAPGSIAPPGGSAAGDGTPRVAEPQGATTKLSPADEAAAFKAAGFTRKGSQWRGCGDSGTASYEAGKIERAADLNGDGLPDALIVEGSSECFGNTGYGFWVVSKQADGRWKLLTQSGGVPEVLRTKGAEGWPDIRVGGPGLCFPVVRWNGTEYRTQRWEYEERPCRPPR
jgi:hypothetical protein